MICKCGKVIDEWNRDNEGNRTYQKPVIVCPECKIRWGMMPD